MKSLVAFCLFAFLTFTLCGVTENGMVTLRGKNELDQVTTLEFGSAIAGLTSEIEGVDKSQEKGAFTAKQKITISESKMSNFKFTAASLTDRASTFSDSEQTLDYSLTGKGGAFTYDMQFKYTFEIFGMDTYFGFCKVSVVSSAMTFNHKIQKGAAPSVTSLVNVDADSAVPVCDKAFGWKAVTNWANKLLKEMIRDDNMVKIMDQAGYGEKVAAGITKPYPQTFSETITIKTGKFTVTVTNTAKELTYNATEEVFEIKSSTNIQTTNTGVRYPYPDTFTNAADYALGVKVTEAVFLDLLKELSVHNLEYTSQHHDDYKISFLGSFMPELINFFPAAMPFNIQFQVTLTNVATKAFEMKCEAEFVVKNGAKTYHLFEDTYTVEEKEIIFSASESDGKVKLKGETVLSKIKSHTTNAVFAEELANLLVNAKAFNIDLLDTAPKIPVPTGFAYARSDIVGADLLIKFNTA
jgi:hypothetical protein